MKFTMDLLTLELYVIPFLAIVFPLFFSLFFKKWYLATIISFAVSFGYETFYNYVIYPDLDTSYTWVIVLYPIFSTILHFIISSIIKNYNK